MAFALRIGEGHTASSRGKLLGRQREDVDFERGELYVILVPVV